jgi:hypothetical protein
LFRSCTREAKLFYTLTDFGENLDEKTNEIFNQVNGFYFERLGVIYENIELLQNGENFKIIKIKSSKSEPTNIRD